MIDSTAVQGWLDAYVRAWQTNEPAEIGALFTDDAEYRWHPWDEGDAVARGREAIVAAWLEDRDDPGTFEAALRPLVVHGDLAIAVGKCRYYTDDSRSTLEHEFHNLWELRFADDGRCRAFTEWFMTAPASG